MSDFKGAPDLSKIDGDELADLLDQMARLDADRREIMRKARIEAREVRVKTRAVKAAMLALGNGIPVWALEMLIAEDRIRRSLHALPAGLSPQQRQTLNALREKMGDFGDTPLGAHVLAAAIAEDEPTLFELN